MRYAGSIVAADSDLVSSYAQMRDDSVLQLDMRGNLALWIEWQYADHHDAMSIPMWQFAQPGH